jgi:hypothetical protein
MNPLTPSLILTAAATFLQMVLVAFYLMEHVR